MAVFLVGKMRRIVQTLHALAFLLFLSRRPLMPSVSRSLCGDVNDWLYIHPDFLKQGVDTLAGSFAFARNAPLSAPLFSSCFILRLLLSSSQRVHHTYV